MPAQIKPKSFESRRYSFFFFLPGVAAPHVYVRAWALGCFHSLISLILEEAGAGKRCSECDQQYSNLSEGADRVSAQLRGDKECPFSGVTKSGRVWRKVPESDARSVQQ